ncbi:MAG: DnaT-like ssDNA-binding domain-containing protein [Succinivibrio sp.]|nr:DnaT-like ssDNA-binding domain-containing protein [Succinatimonas sp.]MDY6247099.1 DnaT-like ssDNA-binding domain-containing protein [Succinivibrio sp.]
MNALEIQYLNKSNLSHIARSLYMLYLRPRSEQNQCLTDLSSIASYLSSDSTYFPTTPNFEVACLVLNELEHAGLIKKEKEDAPWQGNTFILPLFIKEVEELPSKPFYMTNSWRPTASFHEACVLCGLAESSFTEAELKAFTSYWSSKHESRNQVAWERAFAQRLLKQKVSTVKKVSQVKNSALDNADKSIKDLDQNSLQINSQLKTNSQTEEKIREQVKKDLASLFK